MHLFYLFWSKFVGCMIFSVIRVVCYLSTFRNIANSEYSYTLNR